MSVVNEEVLKPALCEADAVIWIAFYRCLFNYIQCRIWRKFRQYGLIPVSYTHLDVYKRQTLTSYNIGKFGNIGILSIFLVKMFAVF